MDAWRWWIYPRIHITSTLSSYCIICVYIAFLEILLILTHLTQLYMISNFREKGINCYVRDWIETNPDGWVSLGPIIPEIYPRPRTKATFATEKPIYHYCIFTKDYITGRYCIFYIFHIITQFTSNSNISLKKRKLN